MNQMEQLSRGEAVMARLAELARYTEEPGRLTRRYLSAPYCEAAAQIETWMREAGMTAAVDAVGNVVGRLEGTQPDLPALIIGSHFDTVRDAGWYDGNLGVIAAIACVETLAKRNERLPFAIEVIAFGDEEGGRFPTTLTGARAVAGRFDATTLDSRDEAGTSLREALTAFGCDPEAAARLGRAREAVHGYVELHIEQGPVLEAEGLPVGIVTAINGSNRFDVSVTGMAGHAGTVPMGLRRDALAGAAEMIAFVESLAKETETLVATVGRIEARPGAVNVVPGEVHFTLDVRAPTDAVRQAAVARIKERLHAIADRRELALSIEQTSDAAATVCNPSLMDQLEAAVERAGLRPLQLPSGAGHDGMVFRELCPVGMLFLRCGGGISHNPAESVTAEDVAVGTSVLLDFIERFEPAA